MTDLTKTDIGRRMYQLHKEKTVERAIEQMRESLGSEWKEIPDADIHMLERLLGEAWVGLDKTIWEKIPFGRMSKGDVIRILDIAHFTDLDHTPKTETLGDLKKILLAVR